MILHTHIREGTHCFVSKKIILEEVLSLEDCSLVELIFFLLKFRN